MNPLILDDKVQSFINENLNANINQLVLKGSPFSGIKIQELANQIAQKKKCQSKLPLWFKTNSVYYPEKVNLEQTSSEITAKFKANLISGNNLIDLTGGFGVDGFFFSKQFSHVTHCETNTTLSCIVSHNYKQFNVNHIDCVAGDGISILKSAQKTFDWIYLDPSRRDDHLGKVFLLDHCQPNLIEHLDLLLAYAPNIMVKLSPLLDISATIQALKYVKQVYVVAVNNEVKELLLVIEKGYDLDIKIEAINIKNEHIEQLTSNWPSLAESQYALPQKYLYEPNSAILKAGLFNEVSHQSNLFKLHNNSHLYTDNHLIDFPGRRFKIQQILTYDKKQIRASIPNGKAHITTRNFPQTVAQIRKKTKLKDGGDIYLFFTTNLENKPIVLLCNKV